MPSTDTSIRNVLACAAPAVSVKISIARSRADAFMGAKYCTMVSMEAQLCLQADRERQMVRRDRWHQDDVRTESSEVQDGARGEDEPGAVIFTDAKAAVVVTGNHPAHRAEPYPAPMQWLGGIHGAAVEGRAQQRIAKIPEGCRPFGLEGTFNADTGIEIVEVLIGIDVVGAEHEISPGAIRARVRRISGICGEIQPES